MNPEICERMMSMMEGMGGMMGMMGMGGMMGWPMLLGIFILALLLGTVLLLLARLLARLPGRESNRAEQILRERLARGEIDGEVYQQHLALIRDPD